MMKEFKEFALKGSVLDLAVGVIIGAAFGKIVTSIVEDLFTPLIGLAVGRIDFTNLFISLNGQRYDTLAAARQAGAPTLNLGLFLNSVFQFVIVSAVLFFIVRWFNRLQRDPEPVEEPVLRNCGYCCREIPVQAVRCPHCTSHLDPQAEAPAISA